MLRLFALLIGLVTSVPECRACLDVPPLTADDIPAGTAADVRVLIEQLLSADIEQRSDAAVKLGALRERADAAIPFLMERLNDYRPHDKIGHGYAAAALVEIGEPALDACIARVMTNGAAPPHDKQRSTAAVECVGRFRSPRAVDALLKLLESTDRDVRSTALQALFGCTDMRATPALLQHIARHGGEEKREAIGCFEVLRDPRAVEPLLKLLEEHGPDSEFYWSKLTASVARALGAQRDRRAVPVLLAIAQRPREDLVTYAAALALGKIGDPRGIRFLAEVLSTPAPRDSKGMTRGEAAHGLAQFHAEFAVPDDEWNDARVLELLVGVLSNEQEDEWLRLEVAGVLRKFGNSGAIEPLCRVAEKHSHDGLGFTAAVSAVLLSDGKLDDVWVVRAFRNRVPPGMEAGPDEVYEAALAKLKANAGPIAQAELVGPTESERQASRERFELLLPRALYVLGIAAGALYLIRRIWTKSVRAA
jgi:HEAT repeat protein